jgi:hypothetical protein
VGAQSDARQHSWQAQRRGGQCLADSAVRARLADLAQEVATREEQAPQALGAYHKSEIEKWWPMIKAAGIKVE